MKFRIEWTQEDLEELLKEKLKESGFSADVAFKWKHRPQLRVSAEVEQRSAAEPETPAPKTVEDVLKKEPPKKKFDDVSFADVDPSLLPEGTRDYLIAIERAAKKEKEKK